MYPFPIRSSFYFSSFLILLLLIYTSLPLSNMHYKSKSVKLLCAVWNLLAHLSLHSALMGRNSLLSSQCLLINPSCKQPQSTSRPGSVIAALPARRASISWPYFCRCQWRCFLSLPTLFWEYYSNSSAVFISNWIVEGDVKEPYITWTLAAEREKLQRRGSRDGSGPVTLQVQWALWWRLRS